MQNDLISRKALIKHLVDWRLQEAPYGICDEETETYKTICGCIEAVKEQPTAYDVEVVVSKMEKVKADVRCAMGVHGPTTNLVCMEMAYENAIQIVRNGGVDNATN